MFAMCEQILTHGFSCFRILMISANPKISFGLFICLIIRKKLRIITILLIKSIDRLIKSYYNKNGLFNKESGDCAMKISYKKLWILLIEKEISPATLRKDLSIATGTMTKLRRNEEVALSVLLRICEYLDCDIGDICGAVKENFEL